jgi:hypothetical protein
MDMDAAFQSLNRWAVATATVSAFVLGGIWYSPLMVGPAWMKVTQLTEEKIKAGSAARTYGGAFVLTLIAAITLGMFLGPQSNPSFGIAAGAGTGIGWIATAFGVVHLFEQRPRLHWFINAAYGVVTLIVMGAILGGWH